MASIQGIGRMLLAVLMLAAGSARAAEPVRVLAAFTLKPALDEIAAAYRKGGGAVTLVYGTSPGLAQQIENGLPADLFFSADPAWTHDLARHHLLKPEAIADLIGNHLVLVGKKGTPPLMIAPDFDLAAIVGAGPIAMCNPDSHPAGRVAKMSLTKLGLWNDIENKVARVENPLLAVKMVGHGDVPFAIVFTTDAMTDPGVAIVATFPDNSHPPIRYPVAILAKSTNPGAARFFDYLRSPDATEIFKRAGYVTAR
jgi:molybdate transport system substrate-binding protein